MTAKTFALIGCRLIGVYFLVSGIGGLATPIAQLSIEASKAQSSIYATSQKSFYAAYLAHGIADAILALILLANSTRIADRMLPRQDQGFDVVDRAE